MEWDGEELLQIPFERRALRFERRDVRLDLRAARGDPCVVGQLLAKRESEVPLIANSGFCSPALILCGLDGFSAASS